MKKKNRRLPPHIVLPDGRWRFIKKSRVGKLKKKGGKKIMARRRSYRRYSRRAVAGFKGILPAAVGGAGDVVARKFIPINGVGSIVAGMFLKDSVTMKIGANKAGESVGAMFLGGGSVAGGNGWL